MQIDQDRIRDILQREHSYYGSREIPIRRDTRWIPDWQNLIAPQLTSSTAVLDIGCGNGHFLIELSPFFHHGLGVDNDPEHIRLAEERKPSAGVHNVEFLLLDFPKEAAWLAPGSFDLVTSFRGPVPDTAQSMQAARDLLRPDGMLFCEEIAELHQEEVNQVFFDFPPTAQRARKVEEMRSLFGQNGFDVRLAADVFTKWIYPDIYAWVEFICNLWTWLDIPLPEPDDPRIAQFAERNTSPAGEIVTTHHVALVAGLKK